jgi:PAS domain S-box-containing protein
MIEPPVPLDVDRQLAAPQSEAIVGAPAKAAFDALTRAAAAACDAPTAYFAFVDRDGLEARETPCADAFVAHTIAFDGLLEVPDTLADARFHDHPFVVGAPNFRFYAGAPLTLADNLRVGALCVFDIVPRRLSEGQRAVLEHLSKGAVHLLEPRKFEVEDTARKNADRAVAELEKVNLLREMGERIAHFGSFRFDSATAEVQWSDEIFRIFGRDKADGPPKFDQLTGSFHPEDREKLVALRNAGWRSEKGISPEFRIIRPDGSERVVHIWGMREQEADGVVSAFGVIQDITDLKTAEREAGLDRDRFNTLFDMIEDAILISDPVTGRHLAVNQGACRMLGYTKSELLELTVSDLDSGIPPFTKEAARQRRREWDGGLQVFDWQLKAKDGLPIWIETSIHKCIFGGLPAKISLARDIGHRKLAEQELTRAKERAERANVLLREANRLRDVGERIANFGCYRMDDATGRLQWSTQLFHIFGLSEADGPPSFSQALALIHPGDQSKVLAVGEARRKSGQSYFGELRLVRADGAQRDVCMWSEPASYEDGAKGSFGVFQDVTERKTAERAAERERNRFNLLFDMVADGILITDPATRRYIEVNQAACRLFGYTKSEFLSCDLGTLSSGIEPYTLAGMEEIYGELQGEQRVFEWMYKTKDHELFWAEVSARAAHFGDTPVILAMLHDITHRKLVEEELLIAKNSAERANRAKSDFLAVMSHEIRTPMNGVLGMNALLMETDLSPQQRKMARTVDDSARALLHLLDEILDVAKLEAGRVTLDEGAFDLSEKVERALKLVEPRAVQKGIALNARIDASARGVFQGAPNALRQVILNLISNAVKFTERGGVEMEAFAASLEGERARIRFEVRDTGIGVVGHAKMRLFAAFEQADTSITRRFGGTGLGLHICRKLIELMRGEIGHLDRPGGGSVFWFEVELRRVGAAECALDPVRPPPSAPASERASGHILLVEDDAVNVEVATLILTAAGYRVDVAHDGDEAVAAASCSDFDLILMDMRMPRRDGPDATREIRALPGRRGRLPILALTANAMAEDRKTCLEAGMDDFVTKPFTPSVLREAVAHWIAGTKSPKPTGAALPAAEDEPVIDGAVVDELLSVMSQSDFAGLVRTYLARAEAQIGALVVWMAEAKTEEIAEEAHKMISAAGALGARRVQKIASRLETACREGGVAQVREWTEALAPALSEAAAHLRRGIAAAEAQV